MNALVAFEAAGRCGSFLQAAESLNVTPSAISRQVKNLEDFLGFDLFVRMHRRIEFTDKGEKYWSVASHSLASIRSYTHSVMATGEKSPIHILCSTSFMRYWLLPRIARFSEVWPTVEFTFTIGNSTLASPREFDIRFKLGGDVAGNLTSRHLMGAGFVPVCSRQYQKLHGALATIDDLAGHTLLHSAARISEWQKWLGPAADRVLDSTRQISFEGDGLAYATALEGVGIALARRCFVIPDVVSGRLAIPISNLPESADGYFVVYHRKSKRPHGFKEFNSYILRESEAFEADVRRLVSSDSLADMDRHPV